MTHSTLMTTAGGSAMKPAAGTDAYELRAQAARTNAAEQRRITSRLRQALEQDGFTLLYQLQRNLQPATLRGAEALIRLQHRRRGLILSFHCIS